VDIFQGISDFQVTSYHSLHVKLDSYIGASEIVPLAWDETDPFNGKVLMAARHTRKPLWGVQYHPESICTDTEGQKVISSWWIEAMKWNSEHQRKMWQETIPPPIQERMKAQSCCESLKLADEHLRRIRELNIVPDSGKVFWKAIHAPSLNLSTFCDNLNFAKSQGIILKSGRGTGQTVIPELGRFSIIAALHSDANLVIQYSVNQKTVTLKGTSSNRQDEHQFGQGAVSNGISELPISVQVTDFWSYLKRFMSKLKFHDGSDDVPFWGGLIGYVSYEAGLQTISVDIANTMESVLSPNTQRPDIQFAFVERSIVVDHLTNNVYIQSLRDDLQWFNTMKQAIKIASKSAVTNGNAYLKPVNGQSQLNGKITSNSPKGKPVNRRISAKPRSWIDYTDKISLCDRAIRAGDSYELCLTDSTKIYTPVPKTDTNSGWLLFKKLGTTNPAPFSAYIRLTDTSEGLTIVSSSPERFLRWSRDGSCQFRPIKGTVKKAPGITYEDARKVLNSSKERAENLMITDLIRHDLHGVAGAGNVSVPKLMQIEEYATVYQLVSVIEGRGLQTRSDSNLNINENPQLNGKTKIQSPSNGIAVLAASLPPGSMTGAPKKRSCELLTEIERHKPRGIYSGVIGYIDVGGGGDFSVVIRTAYKWDSDTRIGSNRNFKSVLEDSHSEMDKAFPENGSDNVDAWDEWTIGAGGAITAQSNAHQEYLEMLTKLNSVLGAFDVEIGAENIDWLNDPFKVSELQEKEKGFIQQGRPFQNTLKCDRPNI
jgi:para-aminobenzoate synthetase